MEDIEGYFSNKDCCSLENVIKMIGKELNLSVGRIIMVDLAFMYGYMLSADISGS